jgi:hypothetical protein
MRTVGADPADAASDMDNLINRFTIAVGVREQLAYGSDVTQIVFTLARHENLSRVTLCKFFDDK